MSAKIITTEEDILNWDTDQFEQKTIYHLNVIINNYKKGFIYGRMQTLAHAKQILAKYNNDASFKVYVHNSIKEDIEHQAKIERIKNTPYSDLSLYEKTVSELI